MEKKQLYLYLASLFSSLGLAIFLVWILLGVSVVDSGRFFKVAAEKNIMKKNALAATLEEKTARSPLGRFLPTRASLATEKAKDALNKLARGDIDAFLGSIGAENIINEYLGLTFTVVFLSGSSLWLIFFLVFFFSGPKLFLTSKERALLKEKTENQN